MNKLDILSKIASNQEKISQDLSTQNESKSRDESVWRPPWDENKKSGYALIAFMPFQNIFYDEGDPKFSTVPYVFNALHNDMLGKTGKKYYDVNCPSSINESCPICTKFFEFYNKSEEDKLFAQKINLSRRRQFYGNIIVLKNDMNPEEVGKIFKWKFGVQIQKKINLKLSPTDGDEPVFVHNPNAILPFKVKVADVGGYRSYINSEWATPENKNVLSYLKDSTLTMEEICDALPSIDDILPTNRFKSETELQNILDDVLANCGLVPENKKAEPQIDLREETPATPKATPVPEVKDEAKDEIDNMFDDFDEL